MVRGMTRRIVEIKETGSGYFEKAIFFVRMDAPQDTGENTLTREASLIIDKFCNDLKLEKQKKKNRTLEILKLSAAAAAGALVAFILLQIWVVL